MIHTLVFTQAELNALTNTILFKDESPYRLNDFLMITVRNDLEKTEESAADKSLTRTQVFFQITDLQDSTTMRGIRNGYVMIKLKRVKSLVPKTTEEATEEA